METVTVPTLHRRCPRHHVVYTPPARCQACVSAASRARDARRGTRQQRGYDREHERLRLVVLRRDAYTCHWCGGPATVADHLVPLVRGGATALENLVAACAACNARRTATVRR